MAERLTVDSVMTADEEVMFLGPVDKEGRRVPLDTIGLYGPCGEHYKVKSFVHFPLVDGWFIECEFTEEQIDVSSLYLKAPDSWERLEEDLSRAAKSKFEVCGYYGTDGSDCCACRLTKDSFSALPECNHNLPFKDIASRIRRLRGGR